MADPIPWDNAEAKGAKGRHRQPQVRPALLQGQERDRQARRLGHGTRQQARHRRSSASWPTRCTKGRAKVFAGRCSCRNHGAAAPCSTCGHAPGSAAAYSLVRNEVRQLDAAMPVYGVKTLESQLDETLMTDRLDRDAFGWLRPARDGARLNRPLRRDGLRRRASQQGDRHPDGARRQSRQRHLERDEGSADPARDRAGASACRRQSGWGD